MAKKITINIKRYDPETEQISIEEHTVQPRHDLTILDALNEINERENAGLSYRFSCRMGICGSCGAVVNGKPVLMCSTFCREFKTPISVEPMRNFPVIKDLVVDTDQAMDKFRDALPYTSFSQQKELKNIPQSPAQLEKIKQTSQCIKCMLCYSACPVYAVHPSFIGPAAAAAGYRYNEDNRDHLREKRMDSLTSKDGVWNCTFVGECSAVCPKSVDPAKAIQKLKIMGVLHSVKSLFKKKK